MTDFLRSLGLALLTVVLSFIVLLLVVHPPQHEPSGPNIELQQTNRHLAFYIHGDEKQPNCIIWSHGLISSRFESMGFSEAVLAEAQAFILSFDRPGYGDSTLHPGRSFGSAVEDVAALADAFNQQKFFIAASSAGGAYALATASLISGRVRGVLLLSAIGTYDLVSKEEAHKEIKSVAGITRARHLQRFIKSPPLLLSTVRWLSETYVGGRALYSLWLEDLGQKIIGRMQDVDARCIMRSKRKEYTLKILPESLRQGSATPVIQDLLLVLRPWPFNITSQIPPHVAPATHIWHSTNDQTVPSAYADALQQAIPGASINIVKDGGHFAYWVCNHDRQKQILSQLIGSGLSV